MSAAAQVLSTAAAKYRITVAAMGGAFDWGYGNSATIWGGTYGECVNTTKFRDAEIYGIVGDPALTLVVQLAGGSLPVSFFTKIVVLDADGARQEFLTASSSFANAGTYSQWAWAGSPVWTAADIGEIKVVEII